MTVSSRSTDVLKIVVACLELECYFFMGYRGFLLFKLRVCYVSLTRSNFYRFLYPVVVLFAYLDIKEKVTSCNELLYHFTLILDT